MTFFRCLIVALGMQFCVCQQSECNRSSISCNDIQAEHPRGFTFLYDCSTGNEVIAYYNQTVIAHAKPKEEYYNMSPAVISMDHSSLVTTECRHLKVQCFLSNGPFVDETCEEMEVTELSPFAKVETPWNLIIGLSVLMLMLIIGMFCYYWRNAIKSRIVGPLQSCCCHRDEGCCVSCSSRCHNGDASQDSTTGDISLVVTSEPHGGGGNEQDNTTGTVQANGNLKDDPGGASAARTMNLNNGCTHGDRGPERQPLLDQRAAVHSPDITVVVALVNKHDFDRDRVSRCSTTQDNDVESNPI